MVELPKNESTEENTVGLKTEISYDGIFPEYEPYEAGLVGDAPSGTVYYDDNEEQIVNLGVHEHWNNSVLKQYSRNLGEEEGIELVFLPTTGEIEISGGNMKIRVAKDDYEVIFALNDSSAATSLYRQLPLTIDVENYSNNEKIFILKNWIVRM